MARWTTRIAETLLTLLGIADLSQAQQVWVVGPPGPGVFSQQIQPAIDAAASGDIVLVKDHPGTSFPFNDYLPFTAGSKSISIIGEGPGTSGIAPVVAPSLITGVSTSNRVLIRGLAFMRLAIVGNAGPVWVEDCPMLTYVFSSPGTTSTLEIAGSASAVLIRCTAIGWNGNHVVVPTLRASSSNVFVYDSSFTGAGGWHSSEIMQHHPGAPAASIQGGFLFASGSTFRGGNGGVFMGTQDPSLVGEPGGPGLVINGAAISLYSSLLQGGIGSLGPAGLGANGAPFVGSPAPTILPGTARHFQMTSPVREQQLATATAKGIPGEGVAMVVSLASSPGAYFAGFTGAILVDVAGADAIHLGIIPPLGTLAVSFTAPDLPPTVMGANVYLQAVHFNPATMQLTVGPASALLVLDSSL